MSKRKVIIVTNTHNFRTPERMWLWARLILFREELHSKSPDLTWRYALVRTAIWMPYSIWFWFVAGIAVFDINRTVSAYAGDHSVGLFHALLILAGPDPWLLLRLGIYAALLGAIVGTIFVRENRQRHRLLRYYGRCTRCGHPKLEDPNTPCIECGNTKPHEPITHWYHPKHSTADQRRRGMWMMTRRREKQLGLPRD